MRQSHEIASVNEKRKQIEPEHQHLSINSQCELVGISRSAYYQQPCGESQENPSLMNRLDELYTAMPFYGIRRLTAALKRSGLVVNHKRVQRLLRLMGIEAVYEKPNLSKPDGSHEVYPYLLRKVEIERCNRVWGTDITYIPLRQGWTYLTAVMDGYSRYVLSWSVSVSLESEFCIATVKAALRRGLPEIVNRDQGSQFTSLNFTGVLKANKIRISMDGKGRAMDNIFVERLWRTVKYEEVYLKEYASVQEAAENLEKNFKFYNTERLHQSLGYRTPEEVYFSKAVLTS